MKKPKPRFAWALVFNGRLSSFVATSKREATGACDPGEVVVKVRLVPVGKPFKVVRYNQFR